MQIFRDDLNWSADNINLRVMRKLLRLLGIIKNEQDEVLASRSWLSCSILPGCISCRWLLKTEALNLVKKVADSQLILRVRDVRSNSDSDVITAIIATEINVYKNEATISLPTNSGMLLAELGFKDRDGIFIVLEYQTIDLGPRILIQPVQQDWFSIEDRDTSIHQKMYELSTKYSRVGGSERISS